MSAFAEEIVTTLQMLNDDVESDWACFEKYLPIFEISVFAQTFYKNIRKSEKEGF